MYDASLYVAGERIGRTAQPTFEVINPANEEVLGSAPTAGPDEIAAAVAGAERALAVWSGVSALDRSNVLRRIATLLRERAESIATLMTLEIGKPIAEARGEVMSAAEYFDWAAEETRRIEGYELGARVAESRYLVRHEPVGIVLALTAWNYPVILPARKLAMALAAGCPVILRPAEEAPACVTALVACCHEAGLPPGAVSLLLGPPEAVVEPLMAEPKVRKVSFTGSTRVGQILIRQSAQTVKRLTLELGGHAPFLVLEDADVSKAAAAAALGKFRNAGQVCTAPSRFYVHEKVCGEFSERMTALAAGLRLGEGVDPAVQMGPLATARQRDRAERLVEDARAKGARLLCGGLRPQAFNRGFFFEPTVMSEVPPDAQLMTEEPFCPVAAITAFSDLDQAVAQANASEFGLAAYVFSRREGEDVARRLEAGVVGLNTVAVAAPEAPFGGVKQSGFGREGGREGVQDYLSAKFVHAVRI
ncbi:MAG TPA: NAD-dependent succinate-semialdehyde dehydrogenase [Phenylobacterium sp.]|nr:NAD-dependent succinate-semialdehyde dehydrogenase [Phenylobacterium sp.]